MTNDARHAEADTQSVTVERSDAMDAAAALAAFAATNRRKATARHNAGPSHASHRAWLRDQAKVYEAAARRMQAAADSVWS